MIPMYKWSTQVEAVELDGDWVILHAHHQTITRLNDVGGWVWTELKEGQQLDLLLDKLVQTYDVTRDQAQVDVTNFIDNLLAAGVIQRAG